MQRKVIVFGLDGATWDLLDPWLSDGKLPTIGELVNEGVKGVLHSTIPPITPVAWASFCTGKNPGKHGVFGFSYRGRLLTTSHAIKAPRIWNILDLYGKRSCILYLSLIHI